jgi:hypothetical protein
LSIASLSPPLRAVPFVCGDVAKDITLVDDLTSPDPKRLEMHE